MSSNSGSETPLLQIFARLVQTPASVLDTKLSLHPDAPRIVVLGPLPGYTSCLCIGQREKSVIKGKVAYVLLLTLALTVIRRVFACSVHSHL